MRSPHVVLLAIITHVYGQQFSRFGNNAMWIDTINVTISEGGYTPIESIDVRLFFYDPVNLNHWIEYMAGHRQHFSLTTIGAHPARVFPTIQGTSDNNIWDVVTDNTVLSVPPVTTARYEMTVSAIPTPRDFEYDIGSNTTTTYSICLLADTINAFFSFANISNLHGIYALCHTNSSIMSRTITLNPHDNVIFAPLLDTVPFTTDSIPNTVDRVMIVDPAILITTVYMNDTHLVLGTPTPSRLLSMDAGVYVSGIHVMNISTAVDSESNTFRACHTTTQCGTYVQVEYTIDSIIHNADNINTTQADIAVVYICIWNALLMGTAGTSPCIVLPTRSILHMKDNRSALLPGIGIQWDEFVIENGASHVTYDEFEFSVQRAPFPAFLELYITTPLDEHQLEQYVAIALIAVSVAVAILTSIQLGVQYTKQTKSFS